MKRLVKPLVCLALLTWILHSIFSGEASAALAEQGRRWNELARGERWELAWTLGPQRLWATMRMVPPGALAASFVFMGFTLVLGMVRWRMMLKVQGLPLEFRRVAEISMVAHFFNSFLLGSTGGDVLKAWYAARETHQKKAEAVTTVFADRLIGLFAMLVFASAMIVPARRVFEAHKPMAAVAAVVFAMAAACTALVLLAFRGGVSRRFPAARDWLRRLPKGEMLDRSLTACRVFGTRPGFLASAFAVSTVLNVACVLQVWVLARGLGSPVPFAILMMAVPSIICISALPVTPSGLGVRENLFVYLLAIPEFGMTPAQAFSLSLLAYAGSLAWSLAGGVVYAFIRERDHLGDLAREAD